MTIPATHRPPPACCTAGAGFGNACLAQQFDIGVTDRIPNRIYRLSAFGPALEAAIKENGFQAFIPKSIRHGLADRSALDALDHGSFARRQLLDPITDLVRITP
jgi:hypothetical protein